MPGGGVVRHSSWYTRWKTAPRPIVSPSGVGQRGVGMSMR
jgi:hypothetical protein